MNGFTIFVLIVVLGAAFIGWKKGFLAQAGRLVGLVLAIAACRVIGPAIVEHFCTEQSGAGDKMMYTVLSYAVLFAVIYIGVSLLARFVRGFLEAIHIGVINQVAGAVFTITEAMLVLSILLNIWEAVWPTETMQADPIYARVLWFAPYILGTEAAGKIWTAVSGAVRG